MVKKMVLVKIMVNGHGHGNGYNQDIGMAKIMVTVRIMVMVKILLIIIVMARIMISFNDLFVCRYFWFGKPEKPGFSSSKYYKKVKQVLKFTTFINLHNIFNKPTNHNCVLT